MSYGVIGDWEWLTSDHGPPDANDIWMRVNHRLLFKSYGGGGAGMMHISKFGDYVIQDEGDLFIGQRQTADDEQVIEMLSKKEPAKDSKNTTPLPKD